MTQYKILDCTLRDGGYYTNWDFDDNVVMSYIEATNKLPIDYLELGYRNNPSNAYMGKFGYSPESVLRQIRSVSTKKLAIMLNEKSTKPSDLDTLLKPLMGLVDMVRMAVAPDNFERAITLAKAVKENGFEVGFNVMYMSKWLSDYDSFLDDIKEVNGVADLFCMVDSYGGITPEEVKTIFSTVKKHVNCAIGFHGHNNLQLGLINTLTAINCGVDFVDATALGMGRGAGNLNMELLLTYLRKEGLDVDLNVLGNYVANFQPLYEKYRWGTTLPYMISGANKIPQKDVMEWVTNRVYSFNSIVRALDNKSNQMVDNARFPLFEGEQAKEVLLIGGGPSTAAHKSAIREYLLKKPSVALIFVTSRHAALYNDMPNKKYYCLVGSEAKRLEGKVSAEAFNGLCVLPPFPRKMGTDVPEYALKHTHELKEVAFTDDYFDSCTTVALQVALDLGAKIISVVGYDGYKGEVLSEKEMRLTVENRTIFTNFNEKTGMDIVSLTDTLYAELQPKSIYQYI